MQSPTRQLLERLKNIGLDRAELTPEASLDAAVILGKDIGYTFSCRQVRAAHNRAAGYVLGEYLANLDESPGISDRDASQMADGYKKDIVFF